MSENVLDKIGVFVFPWGKQPPTIDSLVDMARTIEDLGFESVQIPWHYTMPKVRIFPAFGNRFCLDPTVVLPILARETTRVRIGINSLVLPVSNPYHVAKWFATMDHVSGGRFFGGVASGWWKEDFQAAGVPLKGRTERFDEGLRILADLLAGRPITEPGRFYDAVGLEVEPLPLQEHLPLWVGGGIKSVERAARWADVLCPINPSPAEVRNELRPALDEAGARYGKAMQLACFNYVVVDEDEQRMREFHWPRMVSRLNYISLEEAMVADRASLKLDPDERVMWGTPERAAARMRELLDAGIDYFVLDFHYHGLESEEFAKEQMERFVRDVAPLV